ncbi:MAG: CinA family protein [Campylobacteraceae bacterium]|nr:CinA family protein [Campylobacteraceae bacterium]
MEHALLVVGDTLRTNPLILSYLRKNYISHFHEEGDTFYASRNDTKLLLFLEDLMHRYNTLTIAATKESVHLVGKVLSTLTQDALVLQNGALAPSKAIKTANESYTLMHNEKYINVLNTSFGGSIPPILSPVQIEHCVFNLVGLDTQTCQILLEPLAQPFDVVLHITPWVEGLVRIEAKAQKYGGLEQFLKSVYSLFSDKFFLGNNPMNHIVTSLSNHKKLISCAESCTGGLIVSLLTTIAGASNCIEGSIVSYSNEIKKSWLGVEEDTLDTYGAVSEACIKEMLLGALSASKADIALATSGVAGPDGGSKDKPVGTVFIGVGDTKKGLVTERLLLKGDREAIQTQSAYHVFRLLFQTYPELFFNSNNSLYSRQYKEKP